MQRKAFGVCEGCGMMFYVIYAAYMYGNVLNHNAWKSSFAEDDIGNCSSPSVICAFYSRRRYNYISSLLDIRDTSYPHLETTANHAASGNVLYVVRVRSSCW